MVTTELPFLMFAFLQKRTRIFWCDLIINESFEFRDMSTLTPPPPLSDASPFLKHSDVEREFSRHATLFLLLLARFSYIKYRRW
jgi:hypothetical protein